jgi:hypothetical protein
LILPVGFGDMPTEGTGLAGMPGINGNHGDACQPCFVRDALSQVVEGPIRVWHVAYDGQVPDAFDQHQIHFAFAKGQEHPLPLAALVRNGQASSESPEGNLCIRAAAKDAVIVGLGGMFPKPAAGLAVQRVGVCNLGDTARYHLRRELEPGTTSGVGQLMQLELSEDFACPCLPSDPRTGRVGRLKGVEQDGVLCGSRMQFDVGDQFHASSIEKLVVRGQPWSGCWPAANLCSSSPLNGEVSAKDRGDEAALGTCVSRPSGSHWRWTVPQGRVDF